MRGPRSKAARHSRAIIPKPLVHRQIDSNANEINCSHHIIGRPIIPSTLFTTNKHTHIQHSSCVNQT